MLLFGKKAPWYSDAYRVMLNIALDTLWFGPRPGYEALAKRIQVTLAGELPEENYRAMLLDGTRTNSRHAPHRHHRLLRRFGDRRGKRHGGHVAEALRSLPMRKGERRYYDNCLYFFALLMLCGKYRLY